MTSSSELRRRLQRISPKPAAVDLQEPALPAAGDLGLSGALVDLIPGREVSTDLGAFYLVEERFPLDHAHGLGALSCVLRHSAALAAEVAGDGSLASTPLQQLAFIDTETTGLAGGAGTFAFLVGMGTFDDHHFRLRQYFLRTPAEEKPMLAALLGDLEPFPGFVTFNGKTFDLPLLDSRCIVALRRRINLGARPHLDLLHPARRLWRRQLESCALSSLEQHVLNVARTHDDVPGALIPGMYLDYLRTGEAADMRRVIYHNAMDILSMVVLASHVLDRFGEPGRSAASPMESLALARWHDSRGRSAEAEAAFRKALDGSMRDDSRAAALAQFAEFLKRCGRRVEAVPLWEERHVLLPDDPMPCIEIAKHYEWDAGDFHSALVWSQNAMIALTHWRPGWRRDELWADVQHRVERLRKKAGLPAGPTPGGLARVGTKRPEDKSPSSRRRA